MGFSCGTSACLAGSRAQITTPSTATADASAIHGIALFFFFSAFGGAACTPVEPKTVVMACCAAMGFVFMGAADCRRVRAGEGSVVAPEAAAASAAVLNVFVVDFSVAS